MILQQNLSFSYQLELTGVIVTLETPFSSPSVFLISLNEFAFYSYIHLFFGCAHSPNTACPPSACSCFGQNLVAFSPCVPPVPQSLFVQLLLFHISSICWEKGEPRWFSFWTANAFPSICKDFQNYLFLLPQLCSWPTCMPNLTNDNLICYLHGILCCWFGSCLSNLLKYHFLTWIWAGS